jgi:hypothetical protein
LFVGLVYEFDKSESAFAASFAVEGKAAGLNLAIFTKKMAKIFLLRIKGEVANVESHSD